MSRAVVIMSGGDAASPFTTPDEACASGLASGNTSTALRSFLLERGHQVFTAPAQNGRGVVVDPAPGSFGAFAGQPEVLGEQYTVNSDGDIDLAGEHLTRFLGLLADRYGVDEVDLIGHSNGGLFARSAIRLMQMLDIEIRVRSLTTLGTPWMGSVSLRWAFGEIGDSDLMGQEFAVKVAAGAKARVGTGDMGLAQENTYHYLVGPGRWNEFQGGALDDIPVYSVGGTYFQAQGGDSQIWPNDGLVSDFSAHGSGLPVSVAPRHLRRSFPVTHSIFISDLISQPWETGMTWNEEVLASVAAFLDNPGAASTLTE
jgi:pimeloyl-ACP methyl ester carboxylesterase